MFSFTSIEHYHAQLQEGNITCKDVVSRYLERIDQFSHLNTFTSVYRDEALSAANAVDQRIASRQSLRKLEGVVIGIKDVLAYKQHPLTAASSILQGFNSIYTATAVQRLLDEGAIIIGHLNCDEFAMGSTNENSYYGKVLNPHDQSRVPGGSSGGSAAALAAGLCMASLGSDTGGSVRQPADFCGVIGLKPTYGRISRYGLIAYASSFDHVGIFGLCINDVGLLLQVMAGPDEFDSTCSSKPVPDLTIMQKDTTYRFAYFPEAINNTANAPEISDSLTSMMNLLKDRGHVVEPVSFDLFDYVVPAYYILTTAEASSNLSRYDGVKFGYRAATPSLSLADMYNQTRSTGFGIEVKRRIMLGSFVLSAGYYDAYYTKAQQLRKLVRDKLDEIFSNYDFIILPNSPVRAFPIGEHMHDPVAMYLADIYTVLANLAGIPAISLPIFSHSDGIPSGLQVMSNRFEEVTLLQVSAWLMEQFAKQPE